jgi:hypothetical protein
LTLEGIHNKSILEFKIKVVRYSKILVHLFGTGHRKCTQSTCGTPIPVPAEQEWWEKVEERIKYV